MPSVKDQLVDRFYAPLPLPYLITPDLCALTVVVDPPSGNSTVSRGFPISLFWIIKR